MTIGTAGKAAKEIDLLYSMCGFVGRQSDTATLENSFCNSEKQLNIYLLYIPAIILLSTAKTCLHEKLTMVVHSSFIAKS